MYTLLQIILLLSGFALVIKGADFLIDGSAVIAKKLRISEMAIGLTIVAFGTSLPELVVNVSASFKDSSDLAFGNVLGSNIANVLLVLGFTAVLFKVPIRKKTVVVDLPYSLFAVLLVILFANTALLGREGAMLISFWEGAVLLFFMVAYLLLVYRGDRKAAQTAAATGKATKKYSLLFTAAGVIGLYLGSEWIVDSSVYLSSLLGLSESFLGLTVVALGTTAPELATAFSAGKKGRLDMAVGNIIGSNVFNLLWVLAVSAVISPIHYQNAYNIDMMIIFFSGAVLLAAVITGKKWEIGRFTGILFLLTYLAYLVYIYQRG